MSQSPGNIVLCNLHCTVKGCTKPDSYFIRLFNGNCVTDELRIGFLEHNFVENVAFIIDCDRTLLM